MAAVVLPAWQPEEALITLTDQLWVYGYQIIVVDDGSGESFQWIFRQLKDFCTVLRHDKNKGKGAAIKTALAYIRKNLREESCIGIMDADGQHLPEDMKRLLEHAAAAPGHLILGTRSMGQEMPLKSRLGNRITRVAFRMVSGVSVSDTQTGLRAFDAELADEMLAVEGERYEYEMNVLMTFARRRIPITEVPIRTIYHDRENSCSHFRTVRDSLRIYMEILKFTLSSLTSFLLDYLLFTILTLLAPHTALALLAANICARIVSGLYNYSMNCRFVFRTGRRLRTAADYLALAVLILTLNNVILEMLVQVAKIPVYPAKLMTECLLFILSWLVQDRIIFRKNHKPSPFTGAAAGNGVA